MAEQLRKRKLDPEQPGNNKSAFNHVREEKHLKLVWTDDVYEISSREVAPGSTMYERESDGLDITVELEADSDNDTRFIAPSPISLYFKSISKYPLLTEEQEKKLARMIKMNESECKDLIMHWRILFGKKFLGLFNLKQVKDILNQLRHEHSFLTLFDEISRLVKERKKIEQVLGQTQDGSNNHTEIQEALNRVDAEISKSIARIKSDEVRLAKFVKDIDRIPYQKRVFKNRKEIELEMRKTLRAIDGTAAEIKDLKNQLVKANLRLVISIAKKYLNQGVALADLIQEGNLGLMRAIDTYDHVRGHRLVTYATWWIKQAMIRSIDCQAKTVRTPVYVNEKLNQIMKASNRLLQECKREPTLSEIAAETNTTLESVEKVLKSSKDYIPLEYLVEDKSETVVDAAQDFSCGSIPAQVASEQLSHIVNDMVLSDLTDRERDIIKLRFGIGSEHDHTLEEIGRTFRLSRERIRQILETALRKMRTPAQLMLLREFSNPN